MNQQIPEKIKKLAQDQRIYEILEGIGDKFNLTIDQLGELDAEVRRILLGQSKPQEFTKNIEQLLQVGEETSEGLTAAINTDLFELLKDGLKSESESDLKQETPTQASSDFEKYSGMTLEQEPPKPEDTHPPVGPEDRINLLEGLENPAPVRYRAPADQKPEPLVEHFFNNSTAIPAEEVEHVPAKPAGTDPYKEPLI